MNTVHCIKLDKELEAMEFAPYPGELGQKILNNVSKQAWEEWLNYQTMLINENSLNLMHEQSREYLKTQMHNYFFGGKVDSVVGYTPEK